MDLKFTFFKGSTLTILAGSLFMSESRILHIEAEKQCELTHITRERNKNCISIRIITKLTNTKTKLDALLP